MNLKERKRFWDTLISIEGKDLDAEASLLKSTICYPKHIYRFRPVNSNSLDGLRLNRLFFSSADRYDDPFDSYSHIDWSKVFAEINQSLNDQNSRQWAFNMIYAICGLLPEQTSQLFDMHSNEYWSEHGKKNIENIRKYIQANELSICFTEDELNEVLWHKYADNHHGFVIEYDLHDKSSFLCGKAEKCTLCISSKMNYSLYPIYYSDNKYDATEYIRATAKRMMIDYFPIHLQENAIKTLPNMAWQRERISLIKKKCHWYDKEWRMIFPNYFDVSRNNDRPFICWKPSSITIGLRTSQADKNLIIACAKQAEIPRIYQCFINNKDNLDKKLI